MDIALGTNKSGACILQYLSLSLKNVLNIEVVSLEEAARGVVEKVHWYSTMHDTTQMLL